MIVYAGKQIVVHANEGATDYLLVSFNQLNSEHVASDHYFLQPQVEHQSISCIGVMTTEKGFYLSPEMREVVRIVDETRRGRPVIVFGQSMGGYAALKNSAALRADYVIASSPFYSMDPDDLDLPSERHRKILMHSLAHHGVAYRPEFKNMGITRADASGRLVVLYDPAEMIDQFDADLIGKHLPDAEFITVPHAGHVIYDPSWESVLIAELMKAILDPDRTAIRRAVNRMRRSHIVFLLRSLSKAASRKPRLCAAALRAPRLMRHPMYRALIGDPLNLRAVYLLASRGDHAAAAAHVAFMTRALHGREIAPVAQRDGLTALQTVARWPCLVLSCHGSYMVYDTTRDSVRFEPHPFGRQEVLPIAARIERGVARFVAISGTTEIVVSLTRNAEDGAGEGPDEIIEIDANQIAIRNDGRYLGTVPTGGLQILGGISHQQRLVVLPLPEDSPLARPTPLNWFDQIAIAQQAPAPQLQPVAPARHAQRWRKLFGKG